MTTFLRFVQVFSLGLWVGSILYFAAVVAPAAFSVLTSDLAGVLVGVSLTRLHLVGVISGFVYLLATGIGARSFAGLVQPSALLVVLMIVLTLILQLYVIGTMDALRFQMIGATGSVSGTPLTAPLRAQFDRLHTISVRLEMAVLVSGLAALLLTVRKFGSN